MMSDGLDEATKARMRSVFIDKAYSSRLVRYVKQLNLDTTGHHKELDRIERGMAFMERTQKKRSVLAARIYDRRPDDSLFSLHLTQVAGYMVGAAGDTQIPPVYPGMSAVREFLKPLSVNGTTEYSPWPITQNFYLQSDFEEVREHVRGEMEAGKWGVFLGGCNQAMDFRPMPENEVMERGGFDVPPSLMSGIKNAEQLAAAQGVRLVWVRTPVRPQAPDGTNLLNFEMDEEARSDYEENGLITGYAHLGTRIISDEEGIRIMSAYAPASKGCDDLMRFSLSMLGASLVSREEDGVFEYGECVFYVVTNVSHSGGAINHSWFGSQAGNFERSAYGFSANDDTQNQIYSADERHRLGFIKLALEPLFDRNLELLSLPAYFRLQADAIEDLDVSDLPGSSPRSDTTKANAKGRKASNKWTVVKALRKPMRREFYLGDGEHRTRAAPDHQVEVQGFWRRLRETSFGRGPDGTPVAGRTWVQAHLRYRDKPEPEKSRAKVKEPVAPYLGVRM